MFKIVDIRTLKKILACKLVIVVLLILAFGLYWRIAFTTLVFLSVTILSIICLPWIWGIMNHIKINSPKDMFQRLFTRKRAWLIILNVILAPIWWLVSQKLFHVSAFGASVIAQSLFIVGLYFIILNKVGAVHIPK